VTVPVTRVITALPTAAASSASACVTSVGLARNAVSKPVPRLAQATAPASRVSAIALLAGLEQTVGQTPVRTTARVTVHVRPVNVNVRLAGPPSKIVPISHAPCRASTFLDTAAVTLAPRSVSATPGGAVQAANRVCAVTTVLETASVLTVGASASMGSTAMIVVSRILVQEKF